MIELIIFVEDPPNYSKTDGSKRQITNKENKETAKKRKNQTEIGTIEDFPLDFPDLVLEGSSKEKSVSHAKSVKNDNIGTIEFVDEESIIYGTSTKHSHKRKSEEDSDENEYEIAEQKQTRRRKSSDDEYEIPKETKKRAEVSKEYKTRKKNKNYQLLKREASDDEIDDLYEKYLPPKRTRTYTTNKGKTILFALRLQNQSNNYSFKGLQFILDGFSIKVLQIGCASRDARASFSR